MDQGHTEPGDVDLEEFRDQGHRLIDWIADYLANSERYPVLSRSAPGDVAERIGADVPASGSTLGETLDQFERDILPGITHWNHPGFMGYFAITGSEPGILGELLTAALNVNGMVWRTSPSVTELEETALDWLRQMLGLPAGFSGIIADTASVATLLAILVARERAHGPSVREAGIAGRRLRVYASQEAHSSVDKAAIVAGIGLEGLRHIPVDPDGRMQADALGRAIAEDVATGWEPICVVATVGTTATTAIDPVPAISEVCRAHGLWLHVDGAYGGMAAIVPEHRGVLDGAEFADSIVVNPHKWLFTPIDCSAFFVQDPAALRRAFSLVPEYLATPESGVTNYMDWGFQLGRRFRALKLWMVIRTFGWDGLAARLRHHSHHIGLAQEFGAWVDASPDFVRVAPTPLSVVCLAFRPIGVSDDVEVDRLNAALLESVNATGEVFLSHAEVRGRYALRLAVGHIRTEERHVKRAWDLLQEHAGRLWSA